MAKTMVEKVCINCNSSFMLSLGDHNRGRGRFCGKSCAATGKHGNSYSHGMSKTKEYKTWAGVKSRVLYGNDLNRKYYKDKGIQMSEEWLNSFESFFRDMGHAPSKNHQIDRIEPNGDYCKENCRWVTRTQQMNNTTRNKRLTFQGETLTQEQWSRKLGIASNVISRRLMNGWSLEKTLTTKVGQEKGERFISYKGESKPIRQISEEYGLSRATLSYRIDKLKWPIEKALTTPNLRA